MNKNSKELSKLTKEEAIHIAKIILGNVANKYDYTVTREPLLDHEDKVMSKKYTFTIIDIKPKDKYKLTCFDRVLTISYTVEKFHFIHLKEGNKFLDSELYPRKMFDVFNYLNVQGFAC